ncbi:MAG: transcription termination/antitermination protein NusG [Candidatus Moranbacteria bacterium]|nr:transcription termination/antitermination protein NusG [Candidatus Moranbacteria bacterium]
MKQKATKERAWYVLHTYSGYEENVAKNLRQRIESLDMHDKIFNVLVPTEKKIKIKNGKRKTINEKIYPGYVLVEMIVTDESWYVVRNTPNVTGFTGAGTTPIPLTKEEIDSIKKRMGVEEPKYEINLLKGDTVRITDGPFKDFEGKVQNIDKDRGKVKVLVNIFSRETPVDLDFLQLKKL